MSHKAWKDEGKCPNCGEAECVPECKYFEPECKKCKELEEQAEVSKSYIEQYQLQVAELEKVRDEYKELYCKYHGKYYILKAKLREFQKWMGNYFNEVL